MSYPQIIETKSTFELPNKQISKSLRHRAIWYQRSISPI